MGILGGGEGEREGETEQGQECRAGREGGRAVRESCPSPDKNPATYPTLGIHTEKTRVQRDTGTPVFIAALFTMARTWKQPRRPLADECVRKLCSIYTMESYSAMKKNAFESVLMRWIKLEPLIQSEVRKENTNTVY